MSSLAGGGGSGSPQEVERVGIPQEAMGGAVWAAVAAEVP